MAVKKGKQTVFFDYPVSVSSWACVGGKKEGLGPLKKGFDIISQDSYFGEESFEKAESKMIRTSVELLLSKSYLKDEDIDLFIGGDLMNQCTSTTYGIRGFDFPYYGIYGACSNMGEALSLASLAIESGAFKRIIASASSHFCTAERQFRSPLEYGGVKKTTSQWTVTSCGSVLLERKNSPPYIRAASAGIITDLGVKDISNMGAAMAPVDVHVTPQKNNVSVCFYINAADFKD